MKSDLDELIELLEAELKTLEGYIQNFVEESEYLNAHYHSQASYKVQSQLRILYKLRDPFYDDKQRLEQTIKMFNKPDEIAKSPRLQAYYESKIAECQEELKKLNGQKKDSAYDEQRLDDALFKIIEGVYTGFILYLNASDNLSFTFEKVGLEIEISVTVKSILKADVFLTDEEEHTWPINKFKALGFNLNSTGNRFIYRLETNNLNSTLAVKTLLSRVIYDLFNYYELDNPANLMFF